MTFLELQNAMARYAREPAFFELVFFLSSKVKSKADLISARGEQIDFDGDKLAELMERYLAKEEPLARLTGVARFCGMGFRVDRNVLIPRETSETVVARFAAAVARTDSAGKAFLDLGTGSGCLGIAVAKAFPANPVYGSDVCARALKVAQANAESLGAANFVCVRANFLGCLRKIPRAVSYVICNPPYVAKNHPEAQRSVRRHEPRKAVFAPRGGLAHYERFAAFLARGGWKPEIATFECGFDQRDALARIFAPLAEWYELGFFADRGGATRGCTLTRKKGDAGLRA